MAERIPSSPLFRRRDEGNWRLGEEKTTLSLFNETWGTWGTERKIKRTPKVRYVELRCSHYVFRYRLKVARKIAGFHEALCRVQLTGPLIVTCSETTITRLSLILNFVSREKKKRLIRLARFEDIKGLVRSGNKWKEKLGEGDLLARKWIKLCFVNRSRLYSRGSCALAVSIELSCLIRKEGNVIKGVEFFLFSFCCSLRKSWFRCVKI